MAERPRLSMLHTAHPNVDLFRAVEDRIVFDCRHVVRDDLLKRAVDAGHLTEDVRAETRAALEDFAGESEKVLLTCSTLGPAADDLRNENIIRVDRALAEAALAGGGEVLVLCTVGSTLGPTRDLFESVAVNTGGTVAVRQIKDAWPLFAGGDLDVYFARIAEVADRFCEAGRVIAFGQASMAPAAALCEKARPLTSPEASVAVFAG